MTKKLMFVMMLVATMLFVLVGCDTAEEQEFTLLINQTDESEVNYVVSPKPDVEHTVTGTVTIEVSLAEGYDVNWEGAEVAGPDEDGNYIIDMDSNKEITAVFVEASDDDEEDSPLYNSNFDEDKGLWESRGHMILERSYEVAKDGEYSLKVTRDEEADEPWYGGTRIDLDNIDGLEIGQEYSISLYIYHESDETLEYKIQIAENNNGDGTVLFDKQEVDSGVWTELGGTFIMNEDLDSAWVEEESGIGAPFFIDKVIIDLAEED
ncbi:carbohydrate binding domain-containing protein [Natronospora cellulosivora (SeqCode)]